jgi:molybdopterin-containing oxidoreductase family membrane subunit
MSIVINCGMWFERFVIISVSLHRDFVPSSWAMYSPTWVEISFYLGSLGLFSTAFLLFAKTLPVIAMAEIRHILKFSGEAQKKKQLEHLKAEGKMPVIPETMEIF